MAESFSREKLRHAPQKEGGREILCDLPPVRPRLVRPTNLMSRMNGKKTYTQTPCTFASFFEYLRDNECKRTSITTVSFSPILCC